MVHLMTVKYGNYRLHNSDSITQYSLSACFVGALFKLKMAKGMGIWAIKYIESWLIWNTVRLA